MDGQLDIRELKRRRRERIAAVVLLLVLIAFTGVEVHLLRLSARLPFVNSIFFFGLMNLNLVLIMLLLFLVFRNAVKLILDERRGKPASRLKTRLVFCFILFAIIPTVLLFTISAFYIKNSFDKWFSIKVGGTLQQSIDVVNDYYSNTEASASHFVRNIALRMVPFPKNSDQLEKLIREGRIEYGLDGVEYYASPLSTRVTSLHPSRAESIPAASLETLKWAFKGENGCRIQNIGAGELVRCALLLGGGKGVLFADRFIPIGLASQLSGINLTYEDYRRDNPLNYPIKSTYFAILMMVTLLILFSATWTGFYVAKRLTVPIEELVRGTEEVAHGNLDYQIPSSGSDELYRLVESFNRMTRDLKLTNEELNARRRYIEVLLESVQSGVVSIDQDGCISTINSGAVKLLKLNEEAAVGLPYHALLPERHQAGFTQLLRAVAGTAKPIRRELRVRLPDDEWVTLLVTLSVLRDEGKKYAGVVAVFDDVTELQKMERMTAWREVAKRIAHEIKNPLTPIQLSVQRLRRRYLDKIQDDGAFGEATSIILKEVDSLKTLVNEFSSFARLPEIKPVPDDLNSIVIEAVNLFRAAHEDITFDLDLSEGIPLLELDRAQFKRVLVNLFDNAVSAMERRGTVTVMTEYAKSEGVLRTVVSDEGCGIEEAAYSQLFEPYFSTKEGGTGLGLAIVQRIVADHGGFVRVTANQPRGTKFLIELPESRIVPQLNAHHSFPATSGTQEIT